MEHLRFNDRWSIVSPEKKEDFINFAVDHFIGICAFSIKQNGRFTVALSGGSTPKEIYKTLANSKNRKRIDWTKVFLFWSDERSVPPDHPESNYQAAMDAGFSSLSIPSNQIFRMKAEDDIEKNADSYEEIIKKEVKDASFDLVMLGMGSDGHTASLFPKTKALNLHDKLVAANFVPKLNSWRMTLTVNCINRAKNIVMYVMGKNKAETLQQVFFSSYNPNELPIQMIGTPSNRALWIMENKPFNLNDLDKSHIQI